MELADKLDSFLREKYYAELLKSSKEEKALVVDFGEFDRFDPVTADVLLEDPQRVLDTFNSVAAGIAEEKLNVRIRNLPERKNIRIRNLRAKHMDKMLSVDATVKAASEVKPQINEATFECPECRTILTVKQETNLLQKPFVCGEPFADSGCGRRGDFEIKEKRMFDVRWLTGVEPFEVTSGEQPGEIAISLKEDLTTPKMQKKTDPGNRLKIVGVLKELPKRIKGKLSTKMDMYIEANHVESADKDFEDLDVTPEDEKRIKEMAADPQIYEKLKASIAPGIYGFDEIKEAVTLQLFGGIVHNLPDGSRVRGNIHILLTGDPGVGKSVAGSSKILHNSDDRPEYTTIADLVDRKLHEEKTVLENGAEISTSNNENIRVLALNPKTLEVSWQPVSAFIRHESPEFLVKITTKSGREIIATEDHSFVVLNEDGELANLQGSKVEKGMCVPVPLNAHKEMISEVCVKQAMKTNSKKLPEAVKLDHNFGFFLGMFLSEGSLGRGSVYVDSNDETRKLMIKEFADGIGLNSHIDKNRVIFGSRNFVRFLEENCFKGEKTGAGKGSGASRKRMPDFCFYAPKDFIYGLLSGMFFGDGYFLNAKPSKGRTKWNLKVGYSTISETLACGLVDMLSLVGIFSVIRKKTYTYKGQCRMLYEITALGHHAKRLLDKIRLVGKNREIMRFSEKDAFDVIPCTNLIYGIVKKLGYSKRLDADAEKKRAFAAMMRTVKKRKRLGRRRAERIYSQLIGEAGLQKNKPAIEALATLRNILDASAVWDCIDSVERIRSSERHVYDLSIDGCETFVANNLVVHNTQLLKLVSTMTPRGRYVSGSGVSGAGLTATVVKNEALGSWVLEAGALILCNKGLIAIDEFDKMSRDDQIAMHEATSVETVSIAKASIVATLPAQTAVLAGANPKLGRFDPFIPILEQIHIPETLLSRFDLKFALRDKPDRASDEKLADHIIMSRTNPAAVVPLIDIGLLRKYIAYAKQINYLELSPEAAEALKIFYVDMRNRYSGEDIPTVSITLRQYEALLRMAEASAKVRLDTRIRAEDADRAIRLMKYSLTQLGMEPETGRIDIDRIESGISATKRRKISVLMEIIDAMQREAKEIAIEDLKAEAESQGFDDIDEVIEKLKREGTIFEPRPGFLRKI